MPAGRSGPISLFPILLVNFIGTLGFSIVLPFLVTLVDEYGGNALVYGVMGATYSSFQLIGAPVLGRWSDRFGRRKVLLISQLGTLASWGVFLGALFLPQSRLLDVDHGLLGTFVITLPLAVLFFARALDGLTGGNVSVANAYLADVTTESERKVSFGKMAVAGNLGFILGPTLAGILGATVYGEILPVATALGISALASAVIGFYLPESRPCTLEKPLEGPALRKVFGQEQKDCYQLEGQKEHGLTDVIAIPRVPFLLALYFLIFLGFNLFYTAFPIHAIRGLGWSMTDLGFFFSFLGLTTVLVQGPLLSKVGPKASDGTLTVVGAVVLGTAFLFFTTSSLPLLYAGAGLFSLGNGLMWPSFLSLLSNAAGDRFQGEVQGLGSSVGSFASIVGLVTGGILYELVQSGTFLGSSALIYAVALLCLVAFAYNASRTALNT